MSKQNRHSQNPTGPRTPEGRAVSSRNATKHGITANLVTGAAAEQLILIEAALTAEFNPRSPMESLLIHELAQSQWRKDRALQMELAALDQFPAEPKTLALALRYRTQATNAFYKAYNELRRIQAERYAEDDRNMSSKPAEFVSQKEMLPLKTVLPQPAMPPPPAFDYVTTVEEMEAYLAAHPELDDLAA